MSVPPPVKLNLLRQNKSPNVICNTSSVIASQHLSKNVAAEYHTTFRKKKRCDRCRSPPSTECTVRESFHPNLMKVT